MQALLLLIAIALAGRVALSLLPPGRPGYHEPRELPLTWAASHLLGLVCLAAFGSYYTFVACVALVGVRLATLPGALVPRHELAPRQGGWHRVRTILLALFVLAALARTGSNALEGSSYRAVESANVAALALLIVYGLDGARRHPIGSIAALACLPMAWLSPRALCFGGGAAFAIRWWRRADRRAGMLSVLSFAGIALFQPWPKAEGPPLRLAAVGLLVLIVVTPRPSMPRIARASGIALFALLFASTEPPPWAPSGMATRPFYPASVFREVSEWTTDQTPITWLLALIAVALGSIRALAGTEPGGIEAPRREWVGILALLVGSGLVVVLDDLERGVVLATIAILAGLGIARGDRES